MANGLSKGVKFARGLYKKRSSVRLEELSDMELLSQIFGDVAAQSIVHALDNDLQNLDRIERGNTLRSLGGIGEANAAKLDVLAELAVRIVVGRDFEQTDTISP